MAISGTAKLRVLTEENARIAINRLRGLALTAERPGERWPELAELDAGVRAHVIALLPDALRSAADRIAKERGMR